MSLQPKFQNKTIFWKREHGEFEFEASQYPNSKHDDCLDSVQMHDYVVMVPMYKNPKNRNNRRDWDNQLNPEYLPWNLE